MMATIFGLVGGIGLFLLGMTLLTDGLKSFAGDRLRLALVRFTGRPGKAFASGALATALVQSSSATTVTVIGFVSAGLLTFPQAVGLVMGASLGTTGTGWIVSLLGLKVNMGFYALPLVGAGAFMKLLARGRWKSLGLALAGFGLIFVGIETLQAGMQGLSAFSRLSVHPSTGFFGHLGMMGVGLAMTVVLQSSSAAVAATLTALHTGSIHFEAAASLVIGATVGTTVTGALASIGASVPTKRTALAHVLFNLATGLIAVVLLPVFLGGIHWAQQSMGLEPGAVSLAAFHTAFIALGAAVFLPFVNPFSRRIERLLPETGPGVTRHLDPTVLNVPAVALEAARRALSETAGKMFSLLRDRIGDPRPGMGDFRLAELGKALDQVQQFFADIPPVAEDQPLSRTRVAQMHAMEHLVRLRSYFTPPPLLRQDGANDPPQVRAALGREILQLGTEGLQDCAPADWLERLEKSSRELSELHRQGRPAILRQTAGGGQSPAMALDALDAMRWLDRVGYHTWRICNYLGGEGKPGAFPAEDASRPGE
jgi:phosphate:Na+ symporter